MFFECSFMYAHTSKLLSVHQYEQYSVYVSCGAAIGPTCGSQVEKLFSATSPPPYITPVLCLKGQTSEYPGQEGKDTDSDPSHSLGSIFIEPC